MHVYPIALQLYDLTTGDPVFRFVIVITLVFLFLTVTFAVIAMALRMANDRDFERRERMEAIWMPKILEVLNDDLSAEELRSTVDPGDQDLFLDFLYRFGRQLRGQELETLRGIAYPYLRGMVKDVNRGDAESRARRIQILGLLGFDKYSSLVVEAMNDPSPLVAMVAARILMRRDHPEHVEAVLKKLYRFENWSHDLLGSLLYGLGSGVAPTLRDMLMDPEQPTWIRRVAADALGRQNDVLSADLAVYILEQNEDRALSLAALGLLGRTGRGEHLPTLLQWADAPDAELRAAAVRALSLTGGPAENERLVAALDDPSEWVALYAAQGLRRGSSIGTLREFAASEHPRAELAQQVLIDQRVTA